MPDDKLTKLKVIDEVMGWTVCGCACEVGIPITSPRHKIFHKYFSEGGYPDPSRSLDLCAEVEAKLTDEEQLTYYDELEKYAKNKGYYGTQQWRCVWQMLTAPAAVRFDALYEVLKERSRR